MRGDKEEVLLVLLALYLLNFLWVWNWDVNLRIREASKSSGIRSTYFQRSQRSNDIKSNHWYACAVYSSRQGCCLGSLGRSRWERGLLKVCEPFKVRREGGMFPELDIQKVANQTCLYKAGRMCVKRPLNSEGDRWDDYLVVKSNLNSLLAVHLTPCRDECPMSC